MLCPFLEYRKGFVKALFIHYMALISKLMRDFPNKFCGKNIKLLVPKPFNFVSLFSGLTKHRGYAGQHRRSFCNGIFASF